MQWQRLIYTLMWALFLTAPVAYADLLSNARIEADARHYDAAEKLLREQLAAHGDDDAAQFLLAQVLSWQEKYNDSLAHYDALLRRHPDQVDYLLGKSQVLVWEGKPAAALPLLSKARRNAPHYEEVWRLQIRALMDAGSAHQLRQAKRIRAKAQQRFPNSKWDRAEAQPPRKMVVTERTPNVPTTATPEVVRATQPPVTNEPETGAAAPAQENRRTEIEAGIAHDSLDRGLEDWRSFYVTGLHRLDEGKRIYGGVRETTRFGLQDSEIQAGISIPWASRWTGAIEATYSGTHRVLPKSALRGDIGYSLADGWLAWGGLKHTEYADAKVDLTSLSVERYWDKFRAAYTLSNSRLDSGGSATTHRMQADYFYGDRNRIGLGYVSGQEVENLGQSGVLSSDVRSVFMVGTHWFAPQWGVSYELNQHRQGDSYTRKGISLGIRRLF